MKTTDRLGTYIATMYTAIVVGGVFGFYLANKVGRSQSERIAEESSEIHSRELLKRYDVNGDGVLDDQELRRLSCDIFLAERGWTILGRPYILPHHSPPTAPSSRQ